MSFKLLGVDGDLTQFRLLADRTIRIPPACHAVIPHGVQVRVLTGTVVCMALPGVFMSHNLIVDMSRVEDGEVSTAVFNLSPKVVRVRRGEAISELVSLG